MTAMMKRETHIDSEIEELGLDNQKAPPGLDVFMDKRDTIVQVDGKSKRPVTIARQTVREGLSTNMDEDLSGL